MEEGPRREASALPKFESIEAKGDCRPSLDTMTYSDTVGRFATCLASNVNASRVVLLIGKDAIVTAAG